MTTRRAPRAPRITIGRTPIEDIRTLGILSMYLLRCRGILKHIRASLSNATAPGEGCSLIGRILLDRLNEDKVRELLITSSPHPYHPRAPASARASDTPRKRLPGISSSLAPRSEPR